MEVRRWREKGESKGQREERRREGRREGSISNIAGVCNLIELRKGM